MALPWVLFITSPPLYRLALTTSLYFTFTFPSSLYTTYARPNHTSPALTPAFRTVHCPFASVDNAAVLMTPALSSQIPDSGSEAAPFLRFPTYPAGPSPQRTPAVHFSIASALATKIGVRVTAAPSLHTQPLQLHPPRHRTYTFHQSLQPHRSSSNERLLARGSRVRYRYYYIIVTVCAAAGTVHYCDLIRFRILNISRDENSVLAQFYSVPCRKFLRYAVSEPAGKVYPITNGVSGTITAPSV